MQNLLNRYEKHYGYRATVQELWDLYAQGELKLNLTDEVTLLKAKTALDDAKVGTK